MSVQGHENQVNLKGVYLITLIKTLNSCINLIQFNESAFTEMDIIDVSLRLLSFQAIVMRFYSMKKCSCTIIFFFFFANNVWDNMCIVISSIRGGLSFISFHPCRSFKWKMSVCSPLLIFFFSLIDFSRSNERNYYEAESDCCADHIS